MSGVARTNVVALHRCTCERPAFARCGLCATRLCALCMGAHQAEHAEEPRPLRDRHDGGFAALQSTVREEVST